MRCCSNAHTHPLAIALLLALALAAAAPPAHAALWKCQTEAGETLYTNDVKTTRGKRCQRLTVAPTTTSPRPSASLPSVTPPPSHPDTTRLTPRDDLRHRILQHEYEQEAAQLERLLREHQTASADGKTLLQPRIERHRRNLEAIRRELDRLR
ncbi:DUF4124 domain-containing protein [Hydrogenophilus thiooxidans]|uniref:DUF4124 domain-containing protein n=1 Tax=Hydrogenophilus thiooxidans TaxID=2820326 RepID=UPI001C22EE38|nr:DUF4124 domain-containing protein [Hydrogenophilus thiooxidans]